MSRKHINPGEEYGNLTIISDTGKRDSSGNIIWLCQCDCGNLIERTSRYLTRDLSTHSCGCQKGEAQVKHGDKRRGKKQDRLYSIWRGMLWRCNKNNHGRYSYAKKGVSVCDDWFDYTAFKSWALENGYSEGLSIDRIDNSGNYEPDNCRWVTVAGQANNKSNNHLLTHDGKTMTLAEWAKESGINYSTLRSRVNRQGLSMDKALCKNTGTRDSATGRFIGGYDMRKDDTV